MEWTTRLHCPALKEAFGIAHHGNHSRHNNVQFSISSSGRKLSILAACKPGVASKWAVLSASASASASSSTSSEGSALRVMLAAGGTGGHVYPAIAIADAFQSAYPDSLIQFVGTAERMEWEAVPAAGYPIAAIPAVPLRRPVLLHPLALLLFPFRLLGSLVACFRVLQAFRPDVVVGTGGYVAAPLCLAAALTGHPVVLQEQNARPGLANRALAAFAHLVFLAFPAAAAHFPPHKCILSGNPLRPAFSRYTSKAVAFRHFFPHPLPRRPPNAVVILIVGGSLGAQSINMAAADMAIEMLEMHPNRFIIWQTGQTYYKDLTHLMGCHPRLLLVQFLNHMELAYATSDLVVARSGAITCSELLAMGKPSILIPSSGVAENHQMINATFLSEVGAAEVLPDKTLNSLTLGSAIDKLLEDVTLLERMRQSALKAHIPDGAQKIVKEIMSLVSNKSKR